MDDQQSQSLLNYARIDVEIKKINMLKIHNQEK